MKNYDLVKTRDELFNSQSSKIWGSFAPSALAYDLDRAKTRASEPTLAEMTNKAINTLKKDEDGFFLFVEGSKVDWSHMPTIQSVSLAIYYHSMPL